MVNEHSPRSGVILNAGCRIRIVENHGLTTKAGSVFILLVRDSRAQGCGMGGLSGEREDGKHQRNDRSLCPYWLLHTIYNMEVSKNVKRYFGSRCELLNGNLGIVKTHANHRSQSVQRTPISR